MAEAYTDLLIRIFPAAEPGGPYKVEAELDDGSRFTGGQLLLDRPALLGLELDPAAYGLALFNALFPAGGDLRRAYDQATGKAEAESNGRLRVRLWVDTGAVELHALAWERLYHYQKGQAVPLSASVLTPFSRYTSLETREPAPIAETPLRMLVAIANPSNLPAGLAPANLEVEVENLRRALSGLRRENKITVTLMPGHTGLPDGLRGRLEAEGYQIAAGPTNLFNIAPHLAHCHIFHFIGHGIFRRRGAQGEGEAALLLEKADGDRQLVKDEDIVAMFAALGALPHLTFLVACESAARDADAASPFVGLGPKLVQAGVPAVVAMQEQVPVELARALAGEFYARLAEHGEVDRALNQARLQVFDKKQIEWAVPVLFMRMRTGRLFGTEDEEAQAPGEPPFKGLQYFNEHDADKFYGRELLIAKLVGKLRTSRFLPVIVGASGSGKSSVIRAGVIPALRRGDTLADGTLPPEGSATWTPYLLTPTAQPLQALAAALTRDAESLSATTTLIDDLRIDPRALHLHALKYLSRAGGARLLVVVDQFEETFTLCKDDAERRAFINALLYASSETADGPTVVIIVLRADFYAACAQYANLREAVANRQEFVGPMSAEELRRAIEEPARAGGWDLEPGLVDLILEETGDEPGALPLMQHALLETWKRRRGRLLTLRGYHEAGGIHGAIAKTAQAIYETLPPAQQTVAQRIFLQLVEVGENNQGTRRRALLEELSPRPEDRPAVEQVLKKLVDNRLVVTTDTTAEVAHEALIREWPQLREWLERNREGLRLHRELARNAKEWDDLMREAGGLYRGMRLVQALEWSAEPDNAAQMTDLEREFVAASRAEFEREAREKEEQQRKELEAARQIAAEKERAAEAERQRADDQTRAAAELQRRNRIISQRGLAAGAAAVIALVLGFLALQQAAFGLAGQLASQAAALPATQLDRALLLSALAYDVAPSNRQAYGSLLTNLNRTAVARAFLYGHAGRVNALAFSPRLDELILASGSDDATVRLWDADKRAPLGEPRRGHTDSVLAVAFNPADPQWLASTGYDKQLILWDTTTTVSKTAELPAGGASLAFSPDGQFLAVGTWEGGIELHDAATLVRVRSLATTGTAPVLSLAFSFQGDVLYAGDWDGKLRAWDPASGQPQDPPPFGDVPGSVTALAASASGLAAGYANWQGQLWTVPLDGATTGLQWFGPVAVPPRGRVLQMGFAEGLDGTTDRLIYASANNDLVNWRWINKESFQPLLGYEGPVDSAAFAQRATGLMYATSTGGTIQLWAVEEGQQLPPGVNWFTGHSVLSVADSAHGQVAAGYDNGQIQIWDPAQPATPTVTITSDPAGTTYVSDVAFSPDGQWLAAAGADNQVQIWRAGDGQPVGAPLAGHTDRINDVAFSADGKLLAAASDDGTVRVWDAGSQQPFGGPLTVGGPHTYVLGVAFSPDGKLLAAAATDQLIYLFDLPSGQPHGQPLSGHTAAVEQVTFSPNGQWLASAGEDKTVRLWQLTGGAARQLIGHTDLVRSVAFAPDSRELASAGDDGTVRLWDVATGQPIGAALTGHHNPIYRVAFSRDGQQLVTGSLAGWITLRPLAAAELRRQVCVHAGRNLTEAELAAYLPNVFRLWFNQPLCPGLSTQP